MVLVRSATADDALEVAHVHVRSWQRGYQGLLPQPYLDDLDPRIRADRYSFGEMTSEGPYTMVAVDEGSICGLVTTGVSRDADIAAMGEVWALYVDPPRWGAGIGRNLMSAARDRLLRDGYDQACLWVMFDNTRARRFYEAEGWIRDGRTRTDEVGGVLVDEVRYFTGLVTP